MSTYGNKMRVSMYDDTPICRRTTTHLDVPGSGARIWGFLATGRDWAGRWAAYHHSDPGRPDLGLPGTVPSAALVAKIEQTFGLAGFPPLEKAAVERMEALTAKGGIQRQIYTLARPDADAEDRSQELGLHFDLTVPLARVVVQHAARLAFPFRRRSIRSSGAASAHSGAGYTSSASSTSTRSGAGSSTSSTTPRSWP